MSRKVRRPNLDTVLAQAEKAGRSVKSVTFDPDGGFTLLFVGGDEAPTPTNPWKDQMAE
jgi:hypothetical protein